MITKAHILREIKRTAEANAGTPLGRERFVSETGIKIVDWYGRYWSRWGDALSEAGYSPNQLQAAYDDEKVLSEYVKFVRELGRLPASGDLRLRASNDPGFPSHNVFARFGGKTQLVQRVLSYCRSRPGHEDVVRLCEEYSPRDRRKSSNEIEQQSEEDRFVYLVKSGRFYKIGRSNSAGRRKYKLDLQLPERVKEIHVIRTDDPSGIEAYWHKRFEAKRGGGEWFELNAQDVAAFKRRKFM